MSKKGYAHSAPDASTRVSVHDVAVFTRQFVAMSDAGLPLLSALSFYAQGETSTLASVIEEVARKLQTGVYLSHAMSFYPSIFSKVYVGLVRAGERTGAMGRMLNKLADLLERQARFNKRVMSAMTYPIMLVIVAAICSLIFMYLILPALQPVYASMNVQLPWPTRVVLFAGDLLRSKLFLTTVVLLAVACWMWGRTLFTRLRVSSFGPKMDEFLLLLPVLGPLLRQVIAARVLFALATLLEAGIAIPEALELARYVCGNKYIETQLSLAQAKIGYGEQLSVALSNVDALPRTAVIMIGVGEESDAMVPMMIGVAAIFEEGADLAVTGAAMLLEPVLLMGMGIITGFLVLAAIMPIAKMLENL